MRQIRNLVLFSLAALVLLLTSSGCGGAEGSTRLDSRSYIAMAMQSEEGKHWGLSLFPKRAGTDKCVIHVGMPGIWIHGSCRTSVVIRSKDEATVRFVEHWNAREFFADSDHRQHLHHTWELTLSSQAPGDHVVRSRHYGDFAPQMSR